jgi:DNA polymerase III sliding clamp (beta) subunit (PCNA family)
MQHEKRILDLCKNFVSKDDLRPTLTGINCSEFGVCALNGHSMILIKEEIEPSNFGTYNLKGELIQERYPNFINMIPNERIFDKFCTIDSKDLLHVCSCLSKFHPYQVLAFTFSNNQLGIKTEDRDLGLEATAKLNCEYTGEEGFSVGLNANLLSIILKALIKEGCKLATLKMYGHNRPVVIEHKNITTLLMDIKLNC